MTLALSTLGFVVEMGIRARGCIFVPCLLIVAFAHVPRGPVYVPCNSLVGTLSLMCAAQHGVNEKRAGTSSQLVSDLRTAAPLETSRG